MHVVVVVVVVIFFFLLLKSTLSVLKGTYIDAYIDEAKKETHGKIFY